MRKYRVEADEATLREIRAEIKKKMEKEIKAADRKEWQKKLTEEWYATKREEMRAEVKVEVVNKHYRILTQWKEKEA